MPLGIGNNLIRNGGGLNPDGLSLDLQFAADKTLTARRGPTPVLTRGTSATFVNSAGLIEYAPENLILQSENFASTTWIETGGSMSSVANIAPDGSPNSDLFTEDALTSPHRTFQSFTGVSGTVYTLSVFLKFAGRQYAFIENRSINTNPVVVFDIQNGSVFNNLSGGSLTATIQAYPNGWYRCSVTGTSNLAGGNYIIGGYSGGSQTYTGSGGPAFYAWGAQVEVGPLKSYNRTTTAAFYGPRFDHDPVSPFACRGLLIEEGRTNLLQRSEEFDNSYWTKLRASVDDNATTSPAGDSAADKLIEDNSSGTHMAYRLLNTGALVAHTFSVFAKADGRDFVYLACADGFPANSNAFFDLSNGTRGNIGANATASITAFGNGWYRCSITATPTSTTTNGFYIQTASANGTISYQGNGTSGIFIWGAQLEAGSFATSYIPTTTSALARAADTCNITGDAFNSFYNQSEGTLFADVSGLMNATLSGNRSFVSISDGTYNNFFFIYKNAGAAAISGEGLTNNANQFFYANPYSPSTPYKVALGFKTNEANAAFNGTLGITDTSVTMPTTLNRLELRDPTSAAGGQPSGHIAAIRYYKKRLANAKLITLTT